MAQTPPAAEHRVVDERAVDQRAVDQRAVDQRALQAPAAEQPAADAPAASPAPTASKPPAADAADLAGHYYLDGIMETGSELLLGADGRFQWFLSYGALDLAAQGRWSLEGSAVVLVPERFLAPQGYEAMQFQRLSLRVDGGDLVPSWPWEDGAERGRYSRD